MILLIDNYDSFTYNLYQQLESLGAKTIVKTHDEISIEDIKKLNPSRIIISPGPKNPEDCGISNEAIKNFYKTLPILGVCLGHECIGYIFGSKIIGAKNILHGKTSFINHSSHGIFHGIPSPFKVARYHSLIIDKLPQDFKLTAWDEHNEIMALEHNEYPLHGIQFHPESFMTEFGDKLIKNFLKI